MPKTVRILALAALFVFGGTAVMQAGTGTGTGMHTGRTAVMAMAAVPCMAC